MNYIDSRAGTHVINMDNLQELPARWRSEWKKGHIKKAVANSKNNKYYTQRVGLIKNPNFDFDKFRKGYVQKVIESDYPPVTPLAIKEPDILFRCFMCGVECAGEPSIYDHQKFCSSSHTNCIHCYRVTIQGDRKNALEFFRNDF